MTGVAAAAEEELAGGAQIISLTVSKLRAMLHVRNDLIGVPLNTNKAALVDLLWDAMEGYLSEDEVAPAEDAAVVETDVETVDTPVEARWVDGDYNSNDDDDGSDGDEVGTMHEDNNDEEDVPSSLTPN